jgi:hypothetical protein
LKKSLWRGSEIPVILTRPENREKEREETTMSSSSNKEEPNLKPPVQVVDSSTASSDSSPIESSSSLSAGNSSSENIPPAAAAAAEVGDVTMAQALYAVESLTQLFGVDVTVANQAVQEVGADITVCYNYILDNNLGQDKGGAIYPTDTCPHLQQHVLLSATQIKESGLLDPWTAPCGHISSSSPSPHQQQSKIESTSTGDDDDGSGDNSPTPTRTPALGRPKSDTTTTTLVAGSSSSCCPGVENWLCLECGVIRCSRYEHGHGQAHWEATRNGNNGNSSNNKSNDDDGHCIAVSLADLSVWCHVCSAYLKHERLTPILKTLEDLKFPPSSNGHGHGDDGDESRIT